MFNGLVKTNALALTETASFLAGVRLERYSGWQEIAPNEHYQKCCLKKLQRFR
jgi:hypothetical protein